MSDEHTLIPTAAQAISIRLLWAFSFHGRAKVWTGEKQLRRLSTAAALVPTHSHAPANSTAYTDFPRNQSESRKEIVNPRRVWWSLSTGTPADACPLPFTHEASCKAAQWRVLTYYTWIRHWVFTETEPDRPRWAFIFTQWARMQE